MKKLVMFLVLGLCACNLQDCFPSPDKVQIKPGTYLVSMTDQGYSCTDGTHQDENQDQTVEWTLTENNGQWQLDLNIPPMEDSIDCQPNGPGLTCSVEGTAPWPGCNAPFTVNIDLNPADEGFIGSLVWIYRVSCTNGNAGSCTLTANLEGTLQ